MSGNKARATDFSVYKYAIATCYRPFMTLYLHFNGIHVSISTLNNSCRAIGTLRSMAIKMLIAVAGTCLHWNLNPPWVILPWLIPVVASAANSQLPLTTVSLLPYCFQMCRPLLISVCVLPTHPH